MILTLVCIAHGDSSKELDTTRLQKIVVPQDAIEHLENMLWNQWIEFSQNKKKTDYRQHPTYKLDKEIDIFELSDPPHLSAKTVTGISDTSISLSPFKFGNKIKPKSLVYFFSDDQGQLTYLLFQHYKESLRLSKKTFLYFHDDTFKLVDNLSLMIPDLIIGAYDVKHNFLYFNSPYISSTIDLSDIFKAATDSDITNWGISNNFFSIPSGISNLLTIPYRKRFSSIINNFTNVKLNPQQIWNEAQNFNINLTPDPQNTAKYLLPNTKNELEECLKFLNGDVFHSNLYGEDFETNSKKKLH